MSEQLSPHMRAYVERAQAFAPAGQDLQARRHAFLAACRACTGAAPAHWRIDDLEHEGVRLRVYKPQAAAPRGGWPTLLYVHGGGWDLGNLDTHDWFAFALASRLQAAIVAVEYRLAPEHPYPAPLDDCLKAWQSLRQGRLADDLCIERLIVAGDSAGGTLAAGLCMALRRDGEAQPLGQVLVYPVLTTRTDLPSMSEHAQAPMMTVEGLQKSLAGYLPDDANRFDACAMPLEAANHQGLAPAFIGVAEIDPLRDHGAAYASALSKCGVPVQLVVGRGIIHSSLRAFGDDEVEALYDRMAKWMAERFESQP